MNKNIVPLVKEIIGMNRPQFVSLTYLSKTDKSVSRYTINLGFSYINLLEKSIVELEVLMNEQLDKSTITFQAMISVMESLRKSLEAHNNGTQSDDYTKKGLYSSLINGLNINTVDNTLQLFGLLKSKIVLVEGEPRKTVNSKPITIEKNKIRKQLSISKFREFALDNTNVDSVRINGETLEITPSLSTFKDMGIEINPITVNEPVTV